MRKKILFGFLMGLTILLFVQISFAQPAIDPQIEQLLENNAEVGVIVSLKGNLSSNHSPSIKNPKEREKYLEDIINQVDEIQSRVIPFLAEDEFKLKNKFELSSGFYGNITKKGLEKLKNDNLVEGIRLDEKVYSVGSDNELDVNNEIKEAGVTPDSALWYLDKAIEKIQLALTFNIAKKAEFRLEIANERLVETKIMIEKNKLEAGERSRKERENEIRELEVLIERDETINIQERLEEHKNKAEQIEGPISAIGFEAKSSKDLEEIRDEEIGPMDAQGHEAKSVKIEREPVPNWVLDKGKEHIISYVGEDYFNDRISVKTNWIETYVDKIGAKYRIYYDYKFKIKGDVDDTYIEFILWLDPDGNLVKYRGIGYSGPQRPYTFNISREGAIEIAKENGIREIESVDIISGSGFIGDKGGIKESYVWHIVAKGAVGGESEVIYIDVDSGEIVDVLTKSIGRTVFPVGSKIIELSREEEELIEELIKQEDSDILDKTSFLSAEKIGPIKSNQLKVLYVAKPFTRECPCVEIDVDIDEEKIISIEKY